MNPFEIVLSRRVIPQPIPMVHNGGDCGPCVLGGIFGLSVQQCYEQFKEFKEQTALSWLGMYYAVHRAMAEGFALHVISDVPTWDRPQSMMLFGCPSWNWNLQWFRYITMALQAGYYGIAAVAHDKTGPISRNPGDHWVMVCGARCYLTPIREGCCSVESEIFISNSSTQAASEEWVKVSEFLEKWGGYNTLLVRPTNP